MENFHSSLGKNLQFSLPNHKNWDAPALPSKCPMLDLELVSAKVVSLGSMTFFRAPTSIGSPKAVPHGSERLKGLVVFRAPVVSIGFVFKELTSERVRRKKHIPPVPWHSARLISLALFPASKVIFHTVSRVKPVNCTLQFTWKDEAEVDTSRIDCKIQACCEGPLGAVILALLPSCRHMSVEKWGGILD